MAGTNREEVAKRTATVARLSKKLEAAERRAGNSRRLANIDAIIAARRKLERARHELAAAMGCRLHFVPFHIAD